MRNIDPLAGQVSKVTVKQTVSSVVERVTVTPISSSRHLLQDESQWSWSELRDYVFGEIERRHGPQPRNGKTEASIFKSFLSRWPDGQAVRIAKAAFEIHDGMWGNAPISVNRFCVKSDPFFAAPILTRLEK
jgi:hypothetical protein